MGGCEGGHFEGLWVAAGAIAQKLAYRERPSHWWEQVWGVCVYCRGNVRASLLSGGISHPVQHLQTSTGDSPTFPTLFANAASELPYLTHRVYLCAALLMYSSVSYSILQV